MAVEKNSCVLDVFEVAESHIAEVCGSRLVKTAEKWGIQDKVLNIVTHKRQKHSERC